MSNISSHTIPYYQNAAVRDLAWALYSPGLIVDTVDGFAERWPRLNANWQPSVETTMPWLLQLDQQADQLHLYLKEHESHRLGIYFENLFSFFFTHHPDYDLEARNLAVQGEKRTLGEFDFVYRDNREDVFVHHEVAIKFFLELPQPRTEQPWSRWVGPGDKDRFDLKLLNLLDKQCQLSALPDAERTLQKLNSNVSCEKLAKRVLLKGCLFHHAGVTEPAHYPFANKERLSGCWIHLSDWVELRQKDSADLRWLHLEKQRWVSSLNISDEEQYDLMNSENVMAYCREKLVPQSRPIMLGQYRHVDGLWHEEIRIFVVPDGWPRYSQDTMDSGL